MTATVDKNYLNKLLEPVELGSFAVSSQTRSRETYSGFPELKNSKMWDFSLTENGDGNRILSFLVDNKTLNFELEPSETKGSPIAARRLPDSEPDDFGVGGNAFVGRAQIHKANPEKLLGTFQTGKTNMTFELEKDKENPSKWVIVPRKHPQASVKDFVKTITEKYNKKANYNPINTLAYPLTGGLGGVLASAGIGLGLGAAKGLYDDWRYGKENNQYSVLQKALMGAGLGGLGSYVFQLGGPNYMSDSEKARMLNNMDPNKPFIFSKKFYADPSYLDRMKVQKNGAELSSKKLAFSSGNQTVDLIALQSILGADPTLTQGDRNVLIGQARAALRKAPGSSINMNQMRNMGLGMLAGYALSKLVGFGPIGTVASVAIGGALGGSGRKTGPSWQSGGYWVY